MRQALAIGLAGALALVLTACVGGGGPPRPTKREIAMIDRALTTAPGAAQPSTIVATEVAFGRLAAETTQAAAFLQYAAPTAQVHTAAGLVGVQQWLGQTGFPAAATKWSTRAVAITCDGDLAASTGRYTDSEGIVGNYVMIWERQSDNSYRWIYHAAGPDMPQPPPRVRPRDGDITVTALEAVQGLVASCPRGGDPVPPPPALSLASDRPSDAKLARDGTLRWRWQQVEEDAKFVTAEYFYEGRWLTAFALNLPAKLEP
ncbi:MAG: hypothetical protein ACK4IB_01580 [Erythrobacter sp.]